MTGELYPGPVLVLLHLLLHGSEASCPSMCLCTSDTVSCSSSGLTRLPHSLPSSTIATLDLSYNHLAWLSPGCFGGMPRMETLRLARNELGSLGQAVFRNASSVRHLDLSSNKLRVVESHYFQGLWRLEELLLFNNKIAQVEGGALSGLGSLKKAYFSLNHITDFPFFSIRDHNHPFLSMLDLSSNRLATLPWEDVKSLPVPVQRGLFLHNNTLICECSMHSVFWQWAARGYDTMKDFAEEHVCVARGQRHGHVHFLRHSHVFQHCTVGKAAPWPVTPPLSSAVVSEGQMLRLDCQTSLVGGTDLSFTWLSPSQASITPSSINGTLISLFANGTLEISSTKVNDSGLYVCTAVDFKQMLNATREVNVTVVRPASESFNTGYTTLLGCTVTMVLILMYLYMTPCRCGCCKQPQPAAIPMPTYDPATFSSIFSPSVSHRDQIKAPSNKHVAFLDTVMEKQNGCLKSDADKPSLQWGWETPRLPETPFIQEPVDT